MPINMTSLLKYFASHRTVKCLIYAECRLFLKELLSIPTQSGKTLSHEIPACITFQSSQYTCNHGCFEVTFFHSKASKNELVQEIQCLRFFFQYFLSFGTIRGKDTLGSICRGILDISHFHHLFFSQQEYLLFPG